MGLTRKHRPIHELKAFKSEILNLGWLIFVVLRTPDSAPPPSESEPLVVRLLLSIIHCAICSSVQWDGLYLLCDNTSPWRHFITSRSVFGQVANSSASERETSHTVTSVATRVTCSQSGFIVSLQYCLDLKVCFLSGVRTHSKTQMF